MARPQPQRQPGRHYVPVGIPDLVWAPLMTGLLVLGVGGFSYLVRQPWLFASLGPSAYLHAEYPEHPESTFYNTVAGHFIGILAGFLAVLLVGAYVEPELRYSALRVWAAVIAAVLTVFGQLIADAYHSPAVSTALLVALGVFAPTLGDLADLAIGVVLLATFGEILRRTRVRHLLMHGGV